MDQRSALRVLLAHSQLSQETQEQIAATIDEMPEEDVVKLGTALAEAKRQQIAQAENLAATIDKTLEDLG